MTSSSAWLTILFISVFAFGPVRVHAQDLQHAEDLYRETRYEDSLAMLNKNSKDPSTMFLTGRNYYMMGNFKQAEGYFQSAIAAEPHNSDFEDWLGRAYGMRAESSNPLLAPVLASKARQAFERAVNLNPRNSEALSDLFSYYLEAPGFLGGGYDKALQVANKIAEVDPAEGYFAKAQLAQKRKEFTEAEKQLRQAAALAPHQVGRLLDLAKFLAKEGQTQQSDAIFKQAEHVAPNAPKVWFVKADVLIKEKRDLTEAKNLLQKYVQAPVTVDDPPKEEALRLLKKVDGA